MRNENNLLNSLYNSLNHYNQISTTFDKIEKVNIKLSNLNWGFKIRDLPVLLVAVVVIISFILALSLAFFCAPFLQDHVPTWKEGNGAFIALIWFCAILIVTILLGTAVFVKKTIYNTILNGHNKKLNELSEIAFLHYVDFLNSGYQVIPYTYCAPKIITRFIFYIESGRAETIKESVNCYVNDNNTEITHHYLLLSLSVAQQTAIETEKIREHLTFPF